MDSYAPIVVGVDGSDSSHDAVRWAAVDAARRHAPLLLLTSFPMPLDYVSSVPVPASFYSQLEVEGKQVLAKAAEIATDTARGLGTIDIHSTLLGGPSIPLLLDQSRTARMIVLGSRGLGEFTGGLLGSVTSAVATHAHCPVAVIRGLSGPGAPAADGPVVVGVDGSKNSEPAIAAAFEEASLRGAELKAVHAWTDFNLTTVFRADDKDMGLDWAAITTGEEAVLAESMAGWQERFPEVPVRRVVVKDRAVRNLLEQAQSAQLIVVGTRGRGGFKGMLLGSTSRALLHTVECPLLIVRGQK